ncbi:Mfs transporter [Aspergillus sclerotialis]|uniref:Mfs transporter n=1 Tax=Aspergillus sclerotialis TaxID=2070753 RepID=A0A3A2ZRE7_9EURO|nr:Mfs transporter [Aspergillus sclerotialis]
MITKFKKPVGYKWRSSKVFILSTVTIAIFSENFLYSFIVPILPVMIEDRLKFDPSQTQRITYQVLTVHALTSVISGPIVGYIADKVPSRKVSLMFSLGAEVIGTVVVATCISLPLIILGRIIQAIGGVAVWVVGSATVADTVGTQHLGTTLSMISVFFAAGVLLGPMVAGILMHLFGYWVTWATAIVVLVVDIFMRLVMIESSGDGKEVDAKDKNPEAANEDISDSTANSDARSGDADMAVVMPVPIGDDENTALLQNEHSTTYDSVKNGHCDGNQSPAPENQKPEEKYPASHFYSVMFRQSRVIAALIIQMSNSIILVSFDTTLPLHVKRVFGWNTLNAGLMFGLLQLPLMIFGPVAGRLKDKIGVCYPAGFGFLTLAPLLWLLGFPGEDGTSWFGSGERGKTAYMVTIVCIGLARAVTAGSATIELTCKFSSLSSHGRTFLLMQSDV